MISLRDKETGREIGTITEEQLQVLIDQLEEEDMEDTDYYISRQQLDIFEEQGVDRELLRLLRDALGPREGFEVEWVAPDANG